MVRLCVLLGLILVTPLSVYGQLVVQPATAQETAQAIVDSGITVSNVTVPGATAQGGTFTGGNSAMDTGIILPTGVAPPAVASVTCPIGLIVGGPDGTATVLLTGPALPGGALVILTSSTPAVASVPPSVTVPAGLTSATFTVTPGGSSGTSTITAAYENTSQACVVTVSAAAGAAIPTLDSLGLILLTLLLVVSGAVLFGKPTS